MWAFYIIFNMTIQNCAHPYLLLFVIEQRMGKKEHPHKQGESKYSAYYWSFLVLHKIFIGFSSFYVSSYGKLDGLHHFCEMKWHYFQRLCTYFIWENKESDQRVRNQPYHGSQKIELKFLLWLNMNFSNCFWDTEKY